VILIFHLPCFPYNNDRVNKNFYWNYQKTTNVFQVEVLPPQQGITEFSTEG
jgi:hypothetical protein